VGSRTRPSGLTAYIYTYPGLKVHSFCISSRSSSSSSRSVGDESLLCRVGVGDESLCRVSVWDASLSRMTGLGCRV
jgi:hypothetical protein